MSASTHLHSDPFGSLLGWGTARADLATIAGMRKKLPAWAPPDMPITYVVAWRAKRDFAD